MREGRALWSASVPGDSCDSGTHPDAGHPRLLTKGASSPSGSLVIAILREGQLLLPTSQTVIDDGDILLLSLDGHRVRLTDITSLGSR